MDWLELAGKVLVFLSFWFLAPEIAGEQRLKDLSKGTLSAIAAVLSFIVWVAVFVALGVPLILAFPPSLLPSQPDSPWLNDVRRIGGAVVMVAAVTAARLTRAWLDERVVRPSVKRLSESASLRATWVKIGLWMFVLGNLIDIGWWLWERKLRHFAGAG